MSHGDGLDAIVMPEELRACAREALHWASLPLYAMDKDALIDLARQWTQEALRAESKTSSLRRTK